MTLRRLITRREMGACRGRGRNAGIARFSNGFLPVLVPISGALVDAYRRAYRL